MEGLGFATFAVKAVETAERKAFVFMGSVCTMPAKGTRPAMQV